ncbi:MAG: hypothetical protein J5832_07030 [Clostridia bacterium]|nr:hypothetical protein [Clostridia bacterium]
MKRTAALLLALVICFGSVFALASCDFNIESESNWDVEADTKADSVELVNGFFEETLKDPNLVVTYKSGNDVLYTENVKGTDGYYVSKDGTKVYSFKKGDFYYQAVDGKTEVDDVVVVNRYYYTTDSSSAHYDEDAKTYYDNNYCFFMGDIRFLSLIPEDGGTFTASNKGEEKNGESSAALTFDYSNGESSMKITAKAENNLVKSVSIVTHYTVNPQVDRNITMTFTYGNASVEYPDTDAWDREAAAEEARIAGNEQALNDKSDFFSETTSAENVVVTASIDGEVNYIDAIMNDKERTEFPLESGAYTVYTYMKEVDEGYNDYYYVFDSEESKYYMVNDDAYDAAVLFYYYNGICLYDDAAEEGATLSCTVENGTLTFTIVMDGETKATLVAEKTGDTVSTATYTVKDEGRTVVMTYSFEYGTAEIAEPDLNGFENSSSEGYDAED